MDTHNTSRYVFVWTSGVSYYWPSIGWHRTLLDLLSSSILLVVNRPFLHHGTPTTGALHRRFLLKWVTPVRRYVLTPRSGCRSDRMVPQHLPTPTHCTSYTTTTTITTIANTAKPKQSRLLLPMAMAYGSPLISYRRNRSFPGEKSYKL